MKDVIGVIHLPINAYDYKLSILEEWLLKNVAAHVNGGIKKILLQDQVIERKASIETIGRITALSYIAKRKFPDIDFGLILDSNDCEAAIKIALISNLQFVRIKVFVGAMVKNLGIIEGCVFDNYQLINSTKGKLEIYADVYDKTGTPLGNISYSDACKYAIKMGADKLVLTGNTLKETKEIIEEVVNKIASPIYIGGGVTESNLKDIEHSAYGCIVSSALLEDGSSDTWSVEKISSFMNEFNKHSKD